MIFRHRNKFLRRHHEYDAREYSEALSYQLIMMINESALSRININITIHTVEKSRLFFYLQYQRFASFDFREKNQLRKGMLQLGTESITRTGIDSQCSNYSAVEVVLCIFSSLSNI